MKKKLYVLLVLFFILVISLFGSYTIRESLQVNGNIVADSNVYADTFFGHFSGNVSHSSNSDSLGHLYYDRYLTNINDSFGFLAGDTIQIGDAKIRYIDTLEAMIFNKTFGVLSDSYVLGISDSSMEIKSSDFGRTFFKVSPDSFMLSGKAVPFRDYFKYTNSDGLDISIRYNRLTFDSSGFLQVPSFKSDSISSGQVKTTKLFSSFLIANDSIQSNNITGFKSLFVKDSFTLYNDSINTYMFTTRNNTSRKDPRWFSKFSYYFFIFFQKTLRIIY